jgi:integrase
MSALFLGGLDEDEIMAHIRKITKANGSTAFKAEIVVKKNGVVVHRESKTFDRQKLAKDWGLRREVELQGTAVYARRDYLPVGDVIQQYLNEFPPTGRTKTADLKRLLTHEIAKIDIHKLQAKDLIRHVRERGLTVQPQSASHDLIWLGVVFKTMSGIMDIDCDMAIFKYARSLLRTEKLIAASEKRDRRPTKKELWQLSRYFNGMGMLDGRMLDIMWFAIYSARRQAEITRLRWDDIDHEKKTILVRDLKDPRKKNVSKRAKLPRSAYKIIMRQPKIGAYIFPFSGQTISTYFTRATRFLRIDDLHYHDLRHEATSRLFEAGLTIQQVQQVTLHSGWSSLQRYCNLKPEDLDI